MIILRYDDVKRYIQTIVNLMYCSANVVTNKESCILGNFIAFYTIFGQNILKIQIIYKFLTIFTYIRKGKL